MSKDNETKQKLLRTALDLIWEQSYGSISSRRHLPPRRRPKRQLLSFLPFQVEDLAVEAYEEHWTANRRPQLDSIFPRSVRRSNASWPTVIKSMLIRSNALRRRAAKSRGCPFSSLGSELSTQDEKVRLKTKEIADRYCVYFEGSIRDGIRDGVFLKGDPPNAPVKFIPWSPEPCFQARIADDLTRDSKVEGIPFQQLLGVALKIAA